MFEGKVALVTGAASGIGRAAVRLLVAEGAKVIAADRSPAVEEAASAGVVAMEGDVGEEAHVRALVDTAVERFGRLDIAFANAGIGGDLKRLHELTVADWEPVLRVNLIGVFLTIREAARVMVPQGSGAIVATASVAGIRSGAGGMPYSAAKAGVINLVATSANQLAGSGVRVNAICPGLTETGMTAPMFEAARARGTEGKLGQLNPLRRAASPEEAAQVALFLASDAASYVNGQAVAVDGGLSSSHPTVPGKFV